MFLGCLAGGVVLCHGLAEARVAAVTETTLLAEFVRARRQPRMCGATAIAATRRGVQWSTELTVAAQDHCDAMAETGVFGHGGAGDARPQERAQRAGYLGRVTECLAWGQSDPSEVWREWLDSPDHCRLIMNEHVENIGFATSQHEGRRRYWCLLLGE